MPRKNDAHSTEAGTDLSRRDTEVGLFQWAQILSGLGLASAAAIAGKHLPELVEPSGAVRATSKLTGIDKSPFSTTEKQNTFEEVTHYNNFYDFGIDKDAPAKNAQNFRISPWTVSVEGKAAKPRKFSMDEILKLAPLEERICCHRCVEAWSIVVPWSGFSFNFLAELVEPTRKAQSVASESFYDPRQMPEARYAGIAFPYASPTSTC